ncbi:LysR family transcriptional regulator [Acidisoma cellulosilytica]|uniref:LysR family transcriptional regulator n=1 Tax=Acidisoma cellulosilyticum TaxID=2802395 RepID=A0A964E715_9PROT|nr:LysR family transcriptional regulator [Acidisoma cellulosilyticum]MCB8883563.1 LysR family transcriptional regulator [Acidisoma cellulosilyticum]
MDRWAEIELFVRAAELGNLSRAAETLGLSNSAASRHLMALETRLNVRLVQRTTRKLYLTEVGQQFFQSSKTVLATMREAEAAATEQALNATGLLRVSASLSFCIEHLTPIVLDFTRRYPNVTVDVVASNRYYDLLENGVDLAIRTRRVEADSSVTIRRLAETRRLLAASPDYIAQHGTPRHPSELADHKMLLYTLADRPNELAFSKGDSKLTVRVESLLSANDGQVIQAAAIGGLGILAQPAYIIYSALESGQLVRLLDDWDLPRLTMNIAFPTREHVPAKVRLFNEFLFNRFKDNNYESKWTA